MTCSAAIHMMVLGWQLQSDGGPPPRPLHGAGNFRKPLYRGKLKYPPFGNHPFSIKHPQENFSLQNVNWHPPTCKLPPSQRDWRPLICSFCIEKHRNLPSPTCILDGVNLHFGGWIYLGGAQEEKGEPPKGGYFSFSPSLPWMHCIQLNVQTGAPDKKIR